MEDRDLPEKRAEPTARSRSEQGHAPSGQPSRRAPVSGRLAELDGLRGLAALAVVLYHVDDRWCPLGWAAVDVFFVLSGFLITRIILKSADEPHFLSRFYLRRGLRIWPIYYLTLVGLMLVNRLLPTRCNWSGLWYALTYTQNLPLYWGGRNPVFHPSIRHTWTLAIEEQFYLVWPAIVLLLGRQRLVPLALAALMASCLFRLSGGSMFLLAGRLDGLALGGLLAALLSRAANTRDRLAMPRLCALVLAGSVIGLIALGVTRHLEIHAPGLWPGLLILLVNLAAFGGVGLLVQFAGSGWLVPLRLRPLRLVGQMSYGLYLYHGVVLAVSVGSLRLPRSSAMPPFRLSLTLLGILVLTMLSWYGLERPLLALKERWPYGGRAPDQFRTRGARHRKPQEHAPLPGA
jgi:peptidoglycan/LPS O-acetylase OafA/YrhL